MSASDSHRTAEYRSVSNIDSRIVGCTLNRIRYGRVTIFTRCLSLTPTTTVSVNYYVRLYLPRESNVHGKYQTQAWPEHNHYEPSTVSLKLYYCFEILFQPPRRERYVNSIYKPTDAHIISHKIF